MSWWQIGLMAWASTAGLVFALLATGLRAASTEDAWLDGAVNTRTRDDHTIEASAA